MSYQVHNLHSRIKPGKNLNTGLTQTFTCFCLEQSENLKERKMSRRKKHSCPGLLSISFPSGPQAMVEEKRSHHGPPDSLYSAMKRTSFKRTSSSYSGVKEQRLPPSTLSFLSFRKEKQIKTEREKRPCITQKSISFACSRPFTLF